MKLCISALITTAVNGAIFKELVLSGSSEAKLQLTIIILLYQLIEYIYYLVVR